MWALVPAWVKRAVAWLVAGAAVLGAALLALSKLDATQDELDASEAYTGTRKRIDEADIADDSHHAVEWLRNRDPNKR